MSEKNQAEPTIDINEQIQQRIEKVADWQAAGVKPFGQRFDNRIQSSDAKALFVEDAEEQATVTVAGRIMSFRDMGRSIFADVKDFSGRMQVYIAKNKIGEDAFKMFKKIDMGDIVGVTGPIFRTKTGEITIKATGYELLTKGLRPLPEKYHGLTDVEQRYRQRYVDLIANEDSMRVFKQRIGIVSEIRNYMQGLGYLEVETPMLQAQAGGASARPFETYYNALGSDMVMRVAPELNLKRLLVGGFEKVFELNRNFRNEGLSKKHNPEFTVLEAYEAFGDCRSMMDLVEGMITTAATNVIGTLQIEHKNGNTINLTTPWRRVTYEDLIKEYGGEDWYTLSKEEKVAKLAEFKVHGDVNYDDAKLTHELYDRHIEGQLIQPTFVTRVPVEHVPLAKKCEDDATKVDVYELIINGQEMAPGYSELNDPFDQRQRFEDQVAMMAGSEEEKSSAIDEDFLTALEYGMPPAGGMGIGIDRLVMLLTGAETIRDVILFPQLKQLR